ncbi:Acyl dehydratase [Collimonas sp. OK607]|uniref:MaoC family dehydratase n=1 Tax=Collimonas sp. OK607 TaxID=1798194 RepID=UPI0008E9FCFA|nr:MaoC family dehydratase [Collimonas sp. OK607]SFB01002.1 Acyl dehydratase [Collimonas sp. OK607]
MKFADLSAGKRIILGPAQVDDEEIIAFAEKYDAQWFHTDPVRAAADPWNGLIASGWHTCCIAMGLLSKGILVDSESYASPGLNYVKWPNPVRAADVLTLEVIVIESRISSTKSWLGIVRWQWVMRNQTGATVLDLEAISLFRLPNTSIPEIGKAVPAPT